MSQHIQRIPCKGCGQTSCSCYDKRFQNDYGANQKQFTKTNCGTPACSPDSNQGSHQHGGGGMMNSVCVEFICDTPKQNPSTGQYEMIEASLVNPVRMWLPESEAMMWFKSGKARECGAGETPNCQKGDVGPPGPRGVSGTNGRDGQPGPQGQQGTAGQNGVAGINGSAGQPGQNGVDGAAALVHAEYVNGMLVINTQNAGQESKDLKISIPNCEQIFEKMCDCWDEIFGCQTCPSGAQY